MEASPSARTQAIKARALELGFDKVGVAAAANADPAGHLARWIALGRHAGMDYMERKVEERSDPTVLLPGARSVIALAMSYYWPQAETSAAAAADAKIARYARGRDYHVVVRRLVRKLRRYIIHEIDPEARVHPTIDTSPVLERAWAARAGIAWIGKSTMAIAQDLGTYTFLATLVTTLELVADAPHDDRCGTCTACLDACPTQAFAGPYELDARRCITYWSVEHRGPLEPTTPDFHGWLAGCDICQEVCPWNKFAAPTRDPRLAPRAELIAPDLQAFADGERSEQCAQAIEGTPLERTGAAALQQNARHLLGR